MKTYRMIADEHGFDYDAVRNKARLLKIEPQIIDDKHYINDEDVAKVIEALKNPKRKSRKKGDDNNSLITGSVNTAVINKLITAIAVNAEVGSKQLEKSDKTNELLQQLVDIMSDKPELEKVSYWKNLGRAIIGK